MMYGEIDDKLKKQLKNDFPEFENTIDAIVDSMENFKELANDYFLCKHQFKLLNKLGKAKIAGQYKKALQDLKDEIHAFLKTLS